MRRPRATRKQRTRSYRRELTGEEAAALQQELQAVAERQALDLELEKAKLLQQLVGTDEQLFALVDDDAELANFADDLEQRGLQLPSAEVQLSLRTSVAFRRAGGRERLPDVGLGHCAST